MGKITLTNIAEELAIRSGLDKETADSFVRAFVATIEKGLDADHLVKVKGLGTFKLMDMNDRSSVDVNSGERITIKGYTKVSFTPDSSMREFVNRPFAHFEPTELNEGYPDEELAEEPVEETTRVAAEEVLPEEPVEETAETIVTEAAEEVPGTVSEETPVVPTDTPSEQDPVEVVCEEGSEEVREEECETAEPEENACDVSQPAEEEPASTDDTPAGAEQVEPEVQPIPEVTPQSERPRRGGWILALLLIALVGGAYYYITTSEVEIQETNVEFDEQSHIAVNPNLEEEFGAEWGDLPAKKSAPAVAEPSEAAPAPVAVAAPADTVASLTSSPTVGEGSAEVEADPAPAPVVQEQKPVSPVIKPDTLVIVPSLASRDIKSITPADTTDYRITGTQVTHKLRNGETLIMLARKYYGDKRLWPYIVKHNGITDFNKVAIGMKINIPILEARE